MHPYVEQVVRNIRADERVGVGGYIRIKSGADPEEARVYLTEERDAAQEAVGSARGPMQMVSLSVPMQMLILAELLLAKPNEPVNVRAVNKAQPSSSGYLAERLEEAAEGLAMMAPNLIEVTYALWTCALGRSATAEPGRAKFWYYIYILKVGTITKIVN